MRLSDPKRPDSETDSGETAEQLRWQVEELQRQLREQRGRQPLPPGTWKPSGLTISVLLVGVVVVVAGAFIGGYLPFEKRESLVRAEAEEREKSLPRMEVMHVGRAGSRSTLSLPGTIQAVTEAPILARTDGYLKSRLVDIGDRVRAGQPLAEIDAPELDQQIRQAEAAVAQAQASLEQAQAGVEQGKANRDLARITADRWKALAAQGVVSQQDNDQYQGQLVAQNANVEALDKAVAAQRSNLAAANANLARLEDVQSYRVVRAPFDGIVTLRNVDVGALVSAGNTLLYRVAQIGTLRTYVNVPQIDANSVHIGQTATLTVANFPGRHFTGAVKRTANALDPASRTMLVEVDVPNSGGALFPGMYADVDLSMRLQSAPLEIPAQALIVRSDGAQVAEVSPDGMIHLAKVTVGRDYGDRVEILQGLEEGATILAVPGETQEGAKVVPVPAQR